MVGEGAEGLGGVGAGLGGELVGVIEQAELVAAAEELGIGAFGSAGELLVGRGLFAEGVGASGSSDDLYNATPPGAAKSSQIRMLTERRPHDEHWGRSPNVTGQRAIHVKTFVSKLRLDAIEHTDKQVNAWLDAHPEYKVKFVSQSIGRLVRKNTEGVLFMSILV